MGAAAVAGATLGSFLEAIAAVATLLQVAEVEAGAVTLFSPFPPNSWFNSRATECLAQTPTARLIRPGLRRGALAGAPAPRAAALRGPHRLEQAALLKLLEALEGRHDLPVFYLQLGHVGGAEGG